MSQIRTYNLVVLQQFLESLDEDTRASLKKAPGFIQWFDHEALSAFHGLTPRQVVQHGRTEDLASYLVTIMNGFLG